MSSRVQQRGQHPKPARPGILPPGRLATAPLGGFGFRLSPMAPALRHPTGAAQPQAPRLTRKTERHRFEGPSNQAPSMELDIVELDPTTGPVAS